MYAERRMHEANKKYKARIVFAANNIQTASGIDPHELPVNSKTQTYHGRVGSGRTARWRGGIGQDWLPTELFAQETSLPRTLHSIEDTSPENLPRRTNKRNPMYTDGGTKRAVDPQLTRGSSPVDPRFITGTRSALSSWLLTSVQTLFYLCKPFSCKACSGITRSVIGPRDYCISARDYGSRRSSPRIFAAPTSSKRSRLRFWRRRSYHGTSRTIVLSRG